MSAKNEKSKDYRKVFEQLSGTTFSGSPEALADACPWCGKHKFYLNIVKGAYHCKHCDEGGGIKEYLTYMHQQFLAETTAEHRSALGKVRGFSPQRITAHGWAYDEHKGRWLIPFTNPNGSVVNLQTYYPDKAKPNKFNLTGLPTSIYGLERLSGDKDKILFLCEGAFDAIALDYQLKLKRGKYDILATPGSFRESWQQWFAGRKVRALYDNDQGGEQHRERVRKLLGDKCDLRLLRWPKGDDDGSFDGFDLNDLVRNRPEIKIAGWIETNCVIRVVTQPKLCVTHGRAKREQQQTEWLWPHHLFTGTYASFSGQQGTMKSTIGIDLAARYTSGKPMPSLPEAPLTEASMPAGHVLYVHAEDIVQQIDDNFGLAGGDFDKWHTMQAVLKNGDSLNMLEHLSEIEQLIREHGIRLVVVDGQNSVVGAPDIGTDMKGRCNVTNKLHQFAQRLNICLFGIRNEDKEGRALGSQSMNDLSRCVWRAEETTPDKCKDGRYFKLLFVKISPTNKKRYPPIPYSVQDRSTGEDDSHLRSILWNETFELEKVLGKGKVKR